MTPEPVHDIVVLIGRFQPFHDGHAALLREALALGRQVVVVIGSAHQARTPRNPFTWDERAAMIRLAAGPGDASRLVFAPMRDYYDDARWVAAVYAAVGRNAPDRPEASDIALIGHFKDDTSYYLQRFGLWTLLPRERTGQTDATHLRAALLGAAAPMRAAAIELVAQHVPEQVGHFIAAWMRLPFIDRLHTEWTFLAADREKWAVAPYPPVFSTVDALVTCNAHVLLVRRGHAPGRGLHALPGGFLDPNEWLYDAAVRELREETGLDLLASVLDDCFDSVRVFDHPRRSQRGRVITHVHRFDLHGARCPQVRGGDDAAAAEWVPIERLASMEDRFHDDHFHILDDFLGLTA